MFASDIAMETVVKPHTLKNNHPQWRSLPQSRHGMQRKAGDAMLILSVNPKEMAHR
jgi:hypothetical protein